MATTPDMAPNRTRRAAGNEGSGPATEAGETVRRGTARSREAQLEDQVAQLQADIRTITQTLTRIGEDKVNDAKGVVRNEMQHAVNIGERALHQVEDEFGHLEKQLKDTIREKPLTAVAGAVALGFLLAVMTR